MANQGILQAQIKVKNSINLENGFVDNPLLKSVEGEINLTDENSFKGFAGGSAIEHLDTIKSSSQNAVDLTNSLNNLSSLKYAKLEGNFDSSTEGKFSGNTAMQKLDLSQDITIKPNDLAENENLKELPKLDFSNPDLTDIITNDTELKSTTIDLSNQNNTIKLGIHGDSTHQLGQLDFVKVNPEAPFDNQITPQIDVSYTSLDKNGLVNLFNTVPYNVGYKVVGNPTIVDGVASGFDYQNYLVTDSPFSPTTNDSFEVVLDINTKDNSGDQTIFLSRHGSAASRRFGFRFGHSFSGGSRTFFVNPGIDDSWNTTMRSTTTVLANTEYKLKVTYENMVMKFYIDSGSGFVEENSMSNITPMPFYKTIIGTTDYTSGYHFKGSINLNNSYIKINSKVSTGPVGYTISGTGPTVTDGWLSGLNSSSSCRTTQALPAFQTLELMVNVRYPNVTSSSFTPVLSFTDSTPNHNKIWANASGGHGINAGSSTGIVTIDNNTFNYITASSQPNGYFIKMTVVKNVSDYTYTLSLSLDGQTWTSASANYATNICTDYVSFLRTGSGSAGGKPQMNMNTSYIKIDGKLWFGHESKQVTWFNGKPTVNKYLDITGSTGTSSLTSDDKSIATGKGWTLVENGNSKNYVIENGNITWANPNLYLSGSVNYTKVGNPTIVDNVASGFSADNYFIINNHPTSVTEYEIGCKFTITDLISQSIIGNHGSNFKSPQIFIVSNDSLSFYFPKDTAWGNTISTTLTSIGTYWVKVQWKQSDSSYKAYISTDGETYTLISETTNSDLVWTSPMAIGVDWQTAQGVQGYPLTGSIDLNRTYVKVNGKLWFYGKNYTSTNIAPVPANFSYNNTVTPSIGYVDIRTQEFTAAPEGATYNFTVS